MALQEILLLGDPRRQQDPLPEVGGNDDGLMWRCRARGPRWAFVGFWEETGGAAIGIFARKRRVGRRSRDSGEPSVDYGLRTSCSFLPFSYSYVKIRPALAP